MSANKEDFKKELKDLLSKYNATISFTCGGSSDTHGLYDDHLIIEIGQETVFESDGWYISSNSIDV